MTYDRAAHSDRGGSLRAFLLVGMVVALPAVVAHYRLGKFGLHLVLNSFHTAWADAAFPWLTLLASGWVPLVLAVVLLRLNWRSFLMVALGTSLTSLVVQLLKHLVFADRYRPLKYVEQMPGLQLVTGFDLHWHFSFPSGHAAAAFSMCLALAVIIGRRGAAYLLAFVASMLAFTRVYLSQHFTEDVVAGAVVGTVVTTAVYFMLYRGAWSQHPSLERSPWPRQVGK